MDKGNKVVVVGIKKIITYSIKVPNLLNDGNEMSLAEKLEKISAGLGHQYSIKVEDKGILNFSKELEEDSEPMADNLAQTIQNLL